MDHAAQEPCSRNEDLTSGPYKSPEPTVVLDRAEPPASIARETRNPLRVSREVIGEQPDCLGGIAQERVSEGTGVVCLLCGIDIRRSKIGLHNTASTVSQRRRVLRCPSNNGSDQLVPC